MELNEFSNNSVIKSDDHKKFLIALIVILCSGIIMVYSSSYIFAKEVYGSSSYFLFRQVMYSIVGAVVAVIAAKTKTLFWIKYAEHLCILCTGLVLLTYVPGIGLSIKGANRWVSVLGFSFQPGELIKFVMIFVSVKYFTSGNEIDIKEKLKLVLCSIIPLVLIVMQPDFGTFAICLFGIVFCCFLSGYSRKKFYTLLVSGLAGVGFILTLAPYRVERIMSFLDPWKNPMTTGFQIIQSYLAFSNGSLLGEGIGNSNEKLFYLPEAHNDFIFSVVGEEVGFIGVAVLVSLFAFFIYSGFKIAMKESCEKSSLLIGCIVFTIGLQVLLNMGVVLGLLPTKGLNLPFFSYGGSSLVCNFFAVGLIFSASPKR